MVAEPETIVLQHLRDMRRELGQHRDLLLALNDKVQRLDRRLDGLDRRMTEVRDDIELMMKAEIIGRVAMFETRYEARLEALECKVAAADC